MSKMETLANVQSRQAIHLGQDYCYKGPTLQGSNLVEKAVVEAV